MAKARRTKEQPTTELPAELRDDYAASPGKIASDGEAPIGDTTARPFAERVGNEKKVDRASLMSDPLAGVRFTFDYANHRGVIRFDEAPSPEILAIMNESGYKFDRPSTEWRYPIRFTSREQDRLHSKKIYHQVAEGLRIEKGLEPAGQPLPD
jgi:hypothetical protein